MSSSAKVDVWRDKKIKKFKVKLAEREKFDDQAKVDQKKDSTEKRLIKNMKLIKLD